MSINNKVSDEEKLSQLMDGEWHQLAPAESVASLCADEAQRARWMRYHLIRDALRNEPVQVDTGLAARISAAIDDEEDYSNVTQFNAGHEQSAQPEEFDEGQRDAVGGIDQSSAVFDKVGVASGSDITQMTSAHPGCGGAWCCRACRRCQCSVRSRCQRDIAGGRICGQYRSWLLLVITRFLNACTR